jgi:hypothetical protein
MRARLTGTAYVDVGGAAQQEIRVLSVVQGTSATASRLVVRQA